jgi:hypothetical protein
VRIAHVCSAHGFGHVGRQLALGQALQRRDIQVTFFTAAPAAVVADTLPLAEVVPWVADVGIAQRDSLTEDLSQTLTLLDERCDDASIDRLADALRRFDGVIVDMAPPALEAARRAGVPVVAVGNFDWAWIYQHYPQLHPWAERFARWQAPHLGLSISPGPGLHHFATVEPFGPLGRAAQPHALPESSVLVSFGGFGLADMDALLPRIPGVTWVIAAPTPRPERPDILRADGPAYPALVAGADVVFTKPGYGILVEAMLAGVRMVWVDRGAFPEAPHLAMAMQARGDRCVPATVDNPDRFKQALADVVRARLADPKPESLLASSEEALATRILRHFRP